MKANPRLVMGTLAGDLIIPASVSHNGTTYTVTSIGYYAFHRCEGLTSVTIPNTVTSIDHFAFNHCNGLTTVVVPNSVTSIGAESFGYCAGLTSVFIGSSVLSMDEGAFRECRSIQRIKVEAVVPPTLVYRVFDNVPQDVTVEVPCGSEDAYRSAEGWGTYFMNITCFGVGAEDVEAEWYEVRAIDGCIVVEGVDGAEVHVYDAIGRRVGTEGLRGGVYLVRVGMLPARKVVMHR